MLRERATAEEIAQDVMLELWRRRESLDVTESVRGYLLQATRNRTLNALRHRAIVRKSEPHVIEGVTRLPSLDAAARGGAIEPELDEPVAPLARGCRRILE